MNDSQCETTRSPWANYWLGVPRARDCALFGIVSGTSCVADDPVRSAPVSYASDRHIYNFRSVGDLWAEGQKKCYDAVTRYLDTQHGGDALYGIYERRNLR